MNYAEAIERELEEFRRRAGLLGLELDEIDQRSGATLRDIAVETAAEIQRALDEQAEREQAERERAEREQPETERAECEPIGSARTEWQRSEFERAGRVETDGRWLEHGSQVHGAAGPTHHSGSDLTADRAFGEPTERERMAAELRAQREAIARSIAARRATDVVTPIDEDDDPEGEYYRRESWLV
ncbi:hypothetical protein IU443_09075 [Nocardia farcinica]|uniref:Uncharacterized protein n=1 Tax=Nocardia farcinica TaxID=37329 RepID=A0A0H5P8T2_NOCFR|nr:hypothetical protein [Nocardia farcinica]AXK86354.1 hypothetical protein DXT66_12635 [Nocardia farcinica]MBA4857690.1 hypothetical protein [Nocardia farcinica]MBC9817434.1 hypothetical protein [Nocardia farcinica]MBF6251528.1 hypothetical protein [Nocardia farcinica]MBF6263027.1 hypothetical protein [Nocardia farcinica]